MSAKNTPANGEPMIIVDAAGSTARIVIPKAADPKTLTLQGLMILAREKGIEISADIEHVFCKLVQKFQNDPQDINEVFCHATQPVHGTDASIEWVNGFDPDAKEETPHADIKGSVDFYATQSFIRVSTDDHIATIHPATLGSDGRTVTGETIAAHAGKSLSLKIKPSIHRLSNGKLISQIDGLLVAQHGILTVEPVLEVKDTVDFNTGNIDFNGDVVIQRNICDKFKVSASKNVTVLGIVDASSITCGGSLSVRRGIAGRGEGTIDVEGDANIGYLDQVSGSIGGTLCFGHEMIRCTLSVGREIKSDAGKIIGGQVTARGNVTVAELGSTAETPTVLILGDVPSPHSPAGEAATKISELQNEIENTKDETARIQPMADAGGNDAKERLMEITIENMAREHDINQLKERFPELAGSTHKCPYTLNVARQIHAKVSLTIGSQSVVFKDRLRGPVRIWLEGATLMCQFVGSHPQSLHSLPAVSGMKAA